MHITLQMENAFLPLNHFWRPSWKREVSNVLLCSRTQPVGYEKRDPEAVEWKG